LREVADWVERYRRFWEESFDRLDDYLRELQDKPTRPTRPTKHAREKKRGHN
jgi:hypothetical protein